MAIAGDGPVTNGMGEDDPRDQLDALRERIRSGDLSHGERDQLDQLVFVVAVADRRADTAAHDFLGEVAVQRALAAEAWARVAVQLRVMLGQVTGRCACRTCAAPCRGHDRRCHALGEPAGA